MLPTTYKHTIGRCFLTAIHSSLSGYCPDERIRHARMRAASMFFGGVNYSCVQSGIIITDSTIITTIGR